MVDVTILGDINVDVITSPIERYPDKDSQITIPSIQLSPGGCACNTAIACANLGIKTRLIGKLTNDIFSNYLIKTLKKVGVNRKIKIVKNKMTGITLATTFKDMKRSFITYRGTNESLSTNDFKLKDIKGKILIITGFNLLDNLRKDVKRLFEYAQNKGVKTGLDPNWDPKGWTEKRLRDIYDIFKSTDWFFPSVEEGKAISKTEHERLMIKKMRYLGPEIVCLKLGERGCLVGYEDTIKSIGGFKVISTSTTGSGDVFLAGFIKGYLSGWPIDDCITFANATGALSTTNIELKKYPTYKQVMNFLRTRGIHINSS
jgi:sugar/nucleoside kinase (ribokinase family)